MSFAREFRRLGRWPGVVASLILATTAARAGDVVLIDDGVPPPVIVTAETPVAAATYAAEELAYHLERATGVRPAIVSESAWRSDDPAVPRIYVGATRAAVAAGLEIAQLAPEVAVLRTRGSALYIAGRDGPGDPLEAATAAGSLFGVYAWLERDLGVRWLWPGELGTHVPRTRRVIAREVDETITPRFMQRNVRGGLTLKGTHPGLGFSAEVATEYAYAQAVFLRRHRVGRSVPLSYRHAFTDWWKKYGAEHPDWFQLVNGRRGPTRPGASYSMCVSNPEFQQQVVALWKAAGAGPYLNAVENGIMGLCECDRCRAWDGPQPDDFLTHYSPKSKMQGSRFVTDRYVRFWLAVQHEAAKTNPDVTVVVYNYFNYFYHPSPGLALNERILVGSYPSAGWFPRSAEEQAWFKEQWRAWQQTGAQLFSRGNYCLDGYAMPLIFARQFADEFKVQVEHGLVATDYDALTGQWATQGPNLYLLMRLPLRPEAGVDDLLDEYYGAFGVAAPLVRDYFDFWERYALEHRERINQAFLDLDASRWRSWAIAAHAVFPPESFAPAEAILARAAAVTVGTDEPAARVAFLRAGLAHAKLCVRAAALLTVADPQSTPERGRAALAELVAFRQAHAREWIGNFNHSAWIEEASWRIAPDSQPLTQAETNKL